MIKLLRFKKGVVEHFGKAHKITRVDIIAKEDTQIRCRFREKILVVSNGAGHKSLIKQMKILDLNPDAVELKDFRFKLGSHSQRLKKFLPHLSFETKKFSSTAIPDLNSFWFGKAI